MKRFILLVTFFASVLCNAQNGTIFSTLPTNEQDTHKNTITFMGISIDGPQKHFEEQLQQKGFYKNYQGYWTGKFDGSNVNLIIFENHGKVYQVRIIYPSTSEYYVKEHYNIMISKLSRKEKYKPFIVVPIEEESQFNTEEYVSLFSYEPFSKYTEEEIIEQFNTLVDGLSDYFTQEEIQNYKKTFSDIINNNASEFENRTIEKLDKLLEQWEIINNTVTESKRYKKNTFEKSKQTLNILKRGIKIIEEITPQETNIGSVTLGIKKVEQQYYLILDYTNSYNMPHGEDL